MPEDPIADDERALLFVHPQYLDKDGRPTGAALRRRRKGHPKYRPVSVWIRDRLPGGNADALRTGTFKTQGVLEWTARAIRAVTHREDGKSVASGFDVVPDAHGAVGALAAMAAAHAELTGPTHSTPACAALVAAATHLGPPQPGGSTPG